MGFNSGLKMLSKIRKKFNPQNIRLLRQETKTIWMVKSQYGFTHT
jgi:hypothetical protein